MYEGMKNYKNRVQVKHENTGVLSGRRGNESDFQVWDERDASGTCPEIPSVAATKSNNLNNFFRPCFG